MRPAIQIFRQPCPFYTSGHRALTLSAAVSLFIFLFFLAYQPFEFRDFFIGRKLSMALRIGGTTFFVIAFNCLVLSKLAGSILQTEQWTIGRELLWAWWNVSCIGLACYFVLLPFLPVSAGLPSFIQIQKYALVVGILPTIGILSFKRFVFYRSHLYQVLEQNRSIRRQSSNGWNQKLVTVYSENKKEQVAFPVDNLLYIHSSSNYIELHYLEGQKPVKKLLRNKISKMEEYFREFHFIVRCHRTCIVNLNRVLSICRKPQRCTIQLKNVDHPIRVSRTYEERIVRCLG